MDGREQVDLDFKIRDTFGRLLPQNQGLKSDFIM